MARRDAPFSWDRETDLLVVGTGAGALVAAVTAAHHGAKVLIVEKSDLYGGTSATSGGGVWIPDSDSARSQGQKDSPEEAFQYIKSLIGEQVADAKIRAFVQQGREMLNYIERVTELRFIAIPYTDYHAERPGGKMGYRSHEPLPMHADELSQEDFQTLRPTHPGAMLFGFIPWTTMEAAPMVTRAPGWARTMAKVLWRYYSDIPQRLRSKRSRFLVFGHALAGKLKLALNQYGGEMWLNSPLNSLIREGEVVTGAVIQHEGRQVRVRARAGVVLAAGGFERNPDMRLHYLPGGTKPEWSGSQENNTGDAILAGQAVGAAVDLMDEAWWAPTIRVPGESRARPLFYERALPGCVMVNQGGRRYMNEARAYDVAGKAMIEADRPDARTVPSWIIFDAKFRRNYPMGPLLPLIPHGLLPKRIRDMAVRARTIEELAAKTGLPKDALRSTLQTFNEHARRGEDPEFERGQRPYDRYYGDPNVKPNPNLAPIERPPFYAVQVYPGDIGTKGGLSTDANAQVLDLLGRPIPGLYAIGNTSASVMGGAYPGAGSTLGPAMTFGYVSALHALGRNRSANDATPEKGSADTRSHRKVRPR